MKRHICMEWRRPHLCNCHRAMKPKSAHCQKRNPQKTHLWAAILASFSVTGLAMRALAMVNGHFGSNRNEEYILKFGPLFIWCSIWWRLRERRWQQRLREWRWWRRWSHRGFTRRWIFGLTHKYILEMCAEGENEWSTHAFVYGFAFSFFALLTSLLTTYFLTSSVKPRMLFSPCFMMTTRTDDTPSDRFTMLRRLVNILEQGK